MWDYILKIIVIGDAAVGKSSLLVRLTEDRFLVDSDPTIGIEFGSHLVTLETGERIKLQVWDTAGSEQFRSITRSYYKGSAGCLLVYDVSERSSFEHLPSWLKDVRDQAEEGATVALVGNMADLPEERRQVTQEEGAAFAEEHGLLFYETSAKTGANVHAVFNAVAKHVYERHKAQGTPSTQGPPHISLDARPLEGGCCL
ncbi:hypothetical protein MCUN1_003336 [Malassezia cuniculi]|uniref:Uncharacterized protein n=1 Tax=Malassezia cuniculi TaxID=948313 RepID=A0AAF0F178_9BASI|nr:hypothetical protein MCUN1_003336 [Malassezia cuniculi]